MSEFNIGDKVRIKPYAILRECYGMTNYKMLARADTVVTIRDVWSEGVGYYIEEDIGEIHCNPFPGWVWDPKYFKEIVKIKVNCTEDELLTLLTREINE